jgi:hypothetical protein
MAKKNPDKMTLEEIQAELVATAAQLAPIRARRKLLQDEKERREKQSKLGSRVAGLKVNEKEALYELLGNELGK